MGAGNPLAWRWMFGVMAVPSLAFLGAALVIPESPRWLVKQNRAAEATSVLARFGHEDPARESREIQESLSVGNRRRDASISFSASISSRCCWHA